MNQQVMELREEAVQRATGLGRRQPVGSMRGEAASGLLRVETAWARAKAPQRLLGRQRVPGCLAGQFSGRRQAGGVVVQHGPLSPAWLTAANRPLLVASKINGPRHRLHNAVRVAQLLEFAAPLGG